MPFLDEAQTQPTDATVDAPKTQDVQTPGWMTTFGAAFRQDNTIGSLMSAKSLGVDNSPEDPNYSAWNEIKGTKYEPYWNSFSNSNNARYTTTLKQQIDQEEADKRTMAAAGWRGTVAGISAGLVDPAFFVPIGEAEAAGGRGVYSVIGAGARTGAEVGVATAGQEAVLQGTQQTRTGEESALNVGANVVLGSLLGGAAHWLFPGEVAQADKAFRDIHTGEGVPTIEQLTDGKPLASVAPPISGTASSAGAARTDRLTNADLSVDPGWGHADAIAAATKDLSPNLRANFRVVPAPREYTQMLSENTLYQVMHNDGNSLGPSAETMIRVNYQSRMAEAMQGHDTLYSEAKKAGINMSAQDFAERVGDALRNKDTDELGNTYVSQAARSWRQRVYDPFKQEAIDVGLLPHDVDVSTADSYFNRVWNQDKLIQQEPQFKDMVMNHYSGLLANDYSASKTSLNSRLSNIDQRVTDLQSSPDERVQLMGQLRAQGEALDVANADHVETLNQIRDLRQQAGEAYKSGNKEAATKLNDEAKALVTKGGKGLQSYRDQSAALRSRLRNVDQSTGGMVTRADKIIDQMARTEEANNKSLQRLVRQGQRLAKEAQRLDPQTWAERLSNLKDMFASVAQKADADLERVSKATDTSETNAVNNLDEAGGIGAKLQQMQERSIEVQKLMADRLNRIAERIETTDAFDPKGAMQDVLDRVQKVVDDVNRLSLARGERIARMKDKLLAADPEKVKAKIDELGSAKQSLIRDFYDRWEKDNLVSGADHTSDVKPDFTEASKDIADSVFNHLTGVRSDNASYPDYHVPITRGPMKDRTFLIPDKLGKPWLHSDVREVGKRYARTMAGEIELAHRFGRPDMRDQIAEVHQQYADLREKVGAAQTPEEVTALVGRTPGVMDKFRAWARGQKLDQSAKETTLQFLHEDEKGAIGDMEALRDMKRGTYLRDANSTSYARVVRSVMEINYMRQMGNFLFGNLSMMYRPALVHGLQSFMQDGVRPLMQNLGKIVKGEANGFSAAVNELKLAGEVVERYTHGHLSSMAELGDPYARGTTFERLLRNGSNIATHWNGMSAFFDFVRSVGGIMSQHRIIEGAKNGKDARYLAYLGINKDMAQRIAQQYEKFGMPIDGVHVANTQLWDDGLAVRHFRGALNKDLSAMVHRKSDGDVPLVLNTPTGRLLSQFKTFHLAAHQRTMLRGLQESKANFASGLVATTAMGMAAAYLTALRGGADQFQRFEQEVADNPMHLVAEGLDKSSIFALPFEAANNTEAITAGAGERFRFNPIKTPLEKLGGAVSSGSLESSTGSNSNGPYDFIPALLGPTGNLAQNLPLAAGGGINVATGRAASKQQRKAMAAVVPYSNYFLLREAMQALGGDSPYRGN